MARVNCHAYLSCGQMGGQRSWLPESATHISCAQILPGENDVRLVVAQGNGEAKRVSVYIAIRDVVDSRVDACVFRVCANGGELVY